MALRMHSPVTLYVIPVMWESTRVMGSLYMHLRPRRASSFPALPIVRSFRSEEYSDRDSKRQMAILRMGIGKGSWVISCLLWWDAYLWEQLSFVYLAQNAWSYCWFHKKTVWVIHSRKCRIWAENVFIHWVIHVIHRFFENRQEEVMVTERTDVLWSNTITKRWNRSYELLQHRLQICYNDYTIIQWKGWVIWNL